MNKEMSVCGCVCSDCEYLKKSECSGCFKIKGKVWWASYISATVCPIYACVIDKKKINHCGRCPEIPCQLWRDLKDPNYTDEQHEESMRNRIENFKKAE